MDRDVINFAGVMLVCVMSLGGAAFIWTWTRRELRRQKHAEALPPAQQQNFDDRFAQLQQSVDAIAVEVERIAEGQRFSTKLLSEGNRSGAYSDNR